MWRGCSMRLVEQSPQSDREEAGGTEGCEFLDSPTNENGRITLPTEMGGRGDAVVVLSSSVECSDPVSMSDGERFVSQARSI